VSRSWAWGGSETGLADLAAGLTFFNTFSNLPQIAIAERQENLTIMRQVRSINFAKDEKCYCKKTISGFIAGCYTHGT
jgi:hypothetical protein